MCFGSVPGSTCNPDGYEQFDNPLKKTDARGVLTIVSYDDHWFEGMVINSQINRTLGLATVLYVS